MSRTEEKDPIGDSSREVTMVAIVDLVWPVITVVNAKSVVTSDVD